METTHNTRGISGEDLEDEHSAERPEQSNRLLPGGDGTSLTAMERADSVGLGRRSDLDTSDRLVQSRTYSGSGGGESELLVNDEVLAQGDDEEDTEETSAGSQTDQLANVLSRQIRQQAETVHGGNSADEQDTQSTRSGSSRLYCAVLLGSEFASEESQETRPGQESRQCLENDITEDGLRRRYGLVPSCGEVC